MTLEWHEVVSRLLEKQRTGEYRVSINKEITAHDVACRIMRRENFLIACLNRGILNLRLPLPFVGRPLA
jgi:autophagy-related protein 9